MSEGLVFSSEGRIHRVEPFLTVWTRTGKGWKSRSRTRQELVEETSATIVPLSAASERGRCGICFRNRQEVE